MALFTTLGTFALTDTFLVIPCNASDWFTTQVETAIALLTDPDNWEQDSATTVDQAAESSSSSYRDLFYLPDPTGTIQIYAGAAGTVPNGALPCDGTLYNTVDFPQLFGVIGYTYGGSGAQFAVPNLKSLTVIGSGGTVGGVATTVGQSGGEQTHILTSAESPSHTHTDSGHTHSESGAVPTAILVGVGAPVPSALPSPAITGVGNAALSTEGGGGAHNNMQPFMVLQYIILTGLPG